jgi:hypothetical protein
LLSSFGVSLSTSLTNNDETRSAQLPQRKSCQMCICEEAVTVLEAHDAHLLQQVPISLDGHAKIDTALGANDGPVSKCIQCLVRWPHR